MAHLSDNPRRLGSEEEVCQSLGAIRHLRIDSPDVWLFVLPPGRRLCDASGGMDWISQLRQFAAHVHRDAVVVILTSPEDAARTWPRISDLLKFQLWIAIKAEKPACNTDNRLPENHVALLILTKYPGSLRHTKTRIGYTYCPVCNKTTKDYGGKKHTYHSYGTLVSDVWRDITVDHNASFEAIVDRLADMFGIAPHQVIRIVDLRSDASLRPSGSPCPAPIGAETEVYRGTPSESRLINGDCMESLRSLPDNSVDLAFADPPYNLAKRYDSCNDALDIVEYFTWCDHWIDEMTRVLRPGRTCAILNIPQWAIRHFTHMETKLKFQNWIVWEGLSLPVRMIMPAHYSIVCFSKGPPRPLPGIDPRVADPVAKVDTSALKEMFCLRGPCVLHRRSSRIPDREPLTDIWWDVHRLKHNSRRVDHPCQLPPTLMRRMIAMFTRPGEVVLDPFNGAGTTTLCAQAMGRKFLGIELSERYHVIASRRHELLSRGGDPFAKMEGVPTSKNSNVKRIGEVQYAVSKKTLQLEIRSIARSLGRLPTREEVQQMSRYPIRYFDDYFLSWGEVCAAARTTGMVETRPDQGKLSQANNSLTLFDLAAKST